MTHDEARRDALLTLLYDSLFDERGLMQWFDAVAEALGANAVGVSVNQAWPESATLSWSGLEFDCVRAYSEHYYSIDPWRAANTSAPVGLPQCSDQLVDRRVFSRSEFGGEFCRRYEVVDFQSVLLERSELRRTVLAATYTRHPSSFGANLALFAYLAPHAHRVLMLHEKQASAQLRARTLEAAVERSPCGVVMLSPEGRVQFENPEASRCLRAGDGLAIDRHGHLLPAATRRKALAALDEGVAMTLAVERPSGAPPYILVFARVGPSVHVLGGRHDGIIVHIVDPARQPPDAAALLRSVFSLTLAETRVALAVAGGASVKDAAQTLGVAYATARSQMLAVYAKTHTHRQSALAKLVESLGSATLDPDSD